MGKLFDAAVAWNNLLDTNYDLLLGRKGKAASLRLDFQPEDFPHMAGIQYADDVDFGLRKAEIHSAKFLTKILHNEIDDTTIEKSANWKRINGRLAGIIALEETLDSEFLIYKFNPDRVPYGTTIHAEYVIKNVQSGIIFFVFIDQNRVRWFCRSVFRLNVADYTENQARVTVLKKQKRKGNEILSDYISPKYREII